MSVSNPYRCKDCGRFSSLYTKKLTQIENNMLNHLYNGQCGILGFLKFLGFQILL